MYNTSIPSLLQHARKTILLPATPNCFLWTYVLLMPHTWGNNNNNPTYKVPKILSSVVLAAGTWILIKSLQKYGLDLNTDNTVTQVSCCVQAWI